MSSKAEYLKKYISGSSQRKKRKKSKLTGPTKLSRTKIVDDDVDWREIAPEIKSEDEEEFVADEESKPQVAEIIDEQRIAAEKMKWKQVSETLGKRDDRSDISSDDEPPARTRDRHDSDESPPRRHGKEDSDEPPPRRETGMKETYDSDESPPRRRGKEDSDESPPRRKTGMKETYDSDESLPRRRGKEDSDESPPRKEETYDSDESPPRRRGREDSDESPPRRKSALKVTYDSDKSPPRTGNRGDSEKLHPRRQEDSDESRRRRKRQGHTQSFPGKQSGLQTAAVLREENKLTREREKEMIEKMDRGMSGRGAETVFRDKEGRRIDPKLEKIKQKHAEEEIAKQAEKYKKWGRG